MFCGNVERVIPVYVLKEDMWEVCLEEMETYISRCQNTVSQYISTRPILDLCLEADQRLVSRVTKKWW